MAPTIKVRQFDTLASIVVNVDGGEYNRLTLKNPVFYHNFEKNITIKEYLREDYCGNICAIHDKSILDERIKAFRTIVKHGKYNSDAIAGYVYAVKRAYSVLGITDVKELVSKSEIGAETLYIQIVVNVVSMQGKVKLARHLSSFKFRIMDSHPDLDTSKPRTDWIELYPIGDKLKELTSKEKVVKAKPKVNLTGHPTIKKENGDKLEEAMSKLSTVLTDIYNLSTTNSITVSIKIDKVTEQ